MTRVGWCCDAQGFSRSKLTPHARILRSRTWPAAAGCKVTAHAGPGPLGEDGEQVHFIGVVAGTQKLSQVGERAVEAGCVVRGAFRRRHQLAQRTRAHEPGHLHQRAVGRLDWCSVHTGRNLRGTGSREPRNGGRAEGSAPAPQRAHAASPPAPFTHLESFLDLGQEVSRCNEGERPRGDCGRRFIRAGAQGRNDP